jgi:hypothetical protein
MSLETFLQAWLWAEYIVAPIERRSEMKRVAEQHDDEMNKIFEATGLPTLAKEQEKTSDG